MKTTIHNKLVRDNIPQIIRSQGGVPHTRRMEPAEYCDALLAKLREETEEFAESHSAEELADILEVFLALVAAEGHDIAQIETLRQEKRRCNGGFTEQIFLGSVERPE